MLIRPKKYKPAVGYEVISSVPLFPVIHFPTMAARAAAGTIQRSDLTGKHSRSSMDTASGFFIDTPSVPADTTAAAKTA